MEPIRINLPCDDYLPGDLADVMLDGAIIGRHLALVPAVDLHPGHYCGGYCQQGHYANIDLVGHYESLHYEDGQYEPERVLTLMTNPLYFGLHTVGVDVFDPIGNRQSEATPEIDIFLNTGPTPPRNPAFLSQEEGGGPITFSFTQSRELAA